MNDLSAKVLKQLEVSLLQPLGGRKNFHWLVDRSGDELVLRRWSEQSLTSIDFERCLLDSLKDLGWPTAPLTEPVLVEGELYSFSPLLKGQPAAGSELQARERGRLLAKLHQDMTHVPLKRNRPGWRRAENVMFDPTIERVFVKYEARFREEIKIVLWHLERARQRVEDLALPTRASVPIHGDFAPWNLLYTGDRLTGVLDFELGRLDHRVADFALAWRGKYDQVIQGYKEVTPLESCERASITPVWWALLIEQIFDQLLVDETIDDWSIAKLMVRSPIMGLDADAHP